MTDTDVRSDGGVVETFQNALADSSCGQLQNSFNAPFTEVLLEETKPRKLPKRILHFSDGILEEYSTDEEDEPDNDKAALIDPKTLTWLPYLWYLAWWLGNRALSACDFLGEHLAHFFGITTPKFQYEIQEFQRMIEEEEMEKAAEVEQNAGWRKNDPENIYQQEAVSKVKNDSSTIVRTEPDSSINFTNIAKEITDVVESAQITNPSGSFKRF